MLARLVCPLHSPWRTAGKRWATAVVRCCRESASIKSRSGSIEASARHNVGFIAHIDAGKTTATERMLYCAGLTSRVGKVDSGTTVMDYLPPERERGITISSAAISLPWGGCVLNLVDTPGHADFTFEVERTLRVLDGAVILLDAAAGVEAQTVAVWRQAKRCSVPCVAFVNKMDSPRASLEGAVESIGQRLGVQPVLTQLPLGAGREFQGLVDLVELQVLLWPRGGEGRTVSQEPLENLPPETQEEVSRHREKLLEQVAMADDELAGVLLGSEGPLVGGRELRQALQRVCVSGNVVPVLCGSALRGIGIQPLMDAITAYLPPSTDLALQIPALAQELCVYTFKQVYDPHRGLLAYVRVFSGALKPHTTLYNISNNTRERVLKVLMAQADQLEEVQEAGEGSIAVAVGLKNTFTGDTLVKSATVAELLEKEGVAYLLAPPTVPPPVFLSTIEPVSSADQRSMEQALGSLSREDPSLRVTTDTDTGQTVLSGMGELHLEVVQERLRRVYGVACELGQLQVAYRESLLQESTGTATLEGAAGSGRLSVAATVRLTPVEPSEGVRVEFGEVEVGRRKQALCGAVEATLSRGPLLGFPVQAVTVCVEELSGCGLAPPPLLCASLALAVQKALERAEVGLLEPVTELEVMVPEGFVGAVLKDLSSARRAQVKDVSESLEGERVVTAQVPLASLLGYAKELRSMTSGTASFSMLPAGHCLLDSHRQETVVRQLRGLY